MDDATLFVRGTPSPSVEEAPVEKHAEITEVSFSSDGMPPSLYQEAGKLPLVAQNLGIHESYSIGSVKKTSDTVDAFILGEITRKGLPDTSKSYESVLSELSERLGLSDSQNAYTKLEKLSQYARVQSLLDDLSADDMRFKETNPADMTASELKRYLTDRFSEDPEDSLFRGNLNRLGAKNYRRALELKGWRSR